MVDKFKILSQLKSLGRDIRPHLKTMFDRYGKENFIETAKRCGYGSIFKNIDIDNIQEDKRNEKNTSDFKRNVQHSYGE